MADAAALILQAQCKGGRETVDTLDDIASSAANADRAAEKFAAGTNRMARELQQADAAMRTHARIAALTRYEMLNLGRQFADVGVSIASGMPIWMVAIQQGSQIGEVFAEARTRGAGFGDIIRDLGKTVGGLVTRFAPLTLGLAAALGAFSLFEREVDKNTKGATSFGDAWQATLNVVGQALTTGPIGAGLKWLSRTFASVMNAIVSGAMAALDGLVGTFGAAYLAVTKNWRQLPAVIGNVVVQAVNTQIAAIEWLVNAVGGAVNKLAGRKIVGAIDLPEFQAVSSRVADQFVADQKRIQASFRATREGVFARIVAETERLAAAREKDSKSTEAKTKADNEAEKASRELDSALKGVIQSLETAGERSMRDKHEKMLILRRGFDAGKISADQFREAIERLNPSYIKAATLAKSADFVVKPDDLSASAKNLETMADKFDNLLISVDDARYGFEQFRYSIKNADWGGALGGLMATFQGIRGAFANGGLTGGMSALGSVAGQAIGGKTGQALGGGLGLAGLGMGLGSMAMSTGTVGAVTGGLASLGVGFAGQGMAMGVLSTIGAFAGPIALAAGALYAAAKIFNVGGKPSNNGAGYDLVTGQFSGSKRNAETEGAARSAGDAIKGIEASLKAAGIGLTDTVRGLVIGTRDQTQIYLQSGKTLYAAVGDSGAAVDTAFKALLDGATYVSDAQKELVESALAAGKGFDQIGELLSAFEGAQKISGNLADEILRLTDPKAYDTKAVRDSIEAQRKAYADLGAQGLLTAAQLATINDQLTTLEGLQLGEVLKRYADTVETVTDATEGANDNTALLTKQRSLEIELMRLQGDETGALAAERQLELDQLDKSLHATQRLVWAERDLNDARNAARASAQTELSDAQTAVDKARGVLTDAYNREASALQGTIDKFKSFADSLAAFRKQLFSGPNSFGTNPYANAAAEFRRLAALPAASEERLSGIQAASEAFLNASMARAPNAAAYNRDLMEVRRVIADSEKAARSQVSIAERQLKALDASVEGLLTINESVLSVEQAILGLNGALKALGGAQSRADALDPKKAAGADFARYVEGNADILAAYNAYGRQRGQSIADFGKQHWMSTGFQEGRAVVPGFARGGFHAGGLRLVGEEGPEIEVTGPARYFSAEQTRNMLSGDTAAEVKALRAQVERLMIAVEQVAVNTGKTARSVDSIDKTGVYAHGITVGSPVETEAA